MADTQDLPMAVMSVDFGDNVLYAVGLGPVDTTIAPARPRDELMGEICEGIGGGLSVPDALKAVVGGPSLRTFWRWIAEGGECLEVYRAALQSKGERYAEEIVDIADEVPPMVQHANGEHMDATYVAWQKNRIWARQWVASKHSPKKYGDKLDMAVSGDLTVKIVSYAGTDPSA